MQILRFSRLEKFFILSFFVLVFAIYGQSLAGGFVFDDRGIAEHQELFTGMQNVVQVAVYPYWNVEAGLYRPVTLLSYLFNSLLLGHGAWGFHFVNLLLYFGICAGIYVLLKRLFGNIWLAYIAALIFLVLPIHTEVVANITGRSELLALFFSLLTLMEFTKKENVSWRVGLWLLLAIGAKETAIAVIPLAALIIYFKDGTINFEIFKKYFIGISSAAVGAAIYFFMRFFVLGPSHFLGIQTSIIENPLLFTSTSRRIFTALHILTMYVQKTFWPANLCSDYSFNQISVITNIFVPTVIFGALIMLGSFVSIFIFIKRKPIISFASALFFFSFLPVSNLFFPIGTIAGERLFFFPTLGFAIIITYILTRKTTLIYFSGFAMIAYAILSFNHQKVWLTEERLFLSARECAPNSVLSLSNVGTVYYFRGDYDKAAKELEASKAIRPEYSKGLNNLGLVYWKQGRYSEAEELYFKSLALKYPYYGAIENLVLLYITEKDDNKALRWLRIVYPNVDDSVLRSLF